MAIEVITARPFNLSAVFENVEDVLDKVSNDAKQDLQRWANSFDSILPVFEIHRDVGERTVLPKRNEDGRIVSYVISGTSVRYATMTPDFAPRTKPRSLRVQKKLGQVAYVDTSNPKPGIEARETHQLMADKYGPVLTKAVVKVLENL